MGKTRGKIIKSGDSGTLTSRSASGEKVEYQYEQAFSKELGIVDGATVTFDFVKAGEVTMAVSVNPVDKGEIIEINHDLGTGVIFEKESGIKYNFQQKFLKESGFDKGQTVKYTIVNIKETNMATCLVPVV